MPMIDGQMKERPSPIGFWHPGASPFDGPAAWNDNRYKLHQLPGNTFELYDLSVDLTEKSDVAAQNPDVVSRMKNKLASWQKAVWNSNEGQDYPERKALAPDHDLGK